MPPVLFDTSVYITALRQGNDAVLGTRNVAYGSPLWLSAVVLNALFASADARGRKRLAKFERDFVKVNRRLVPEANEWARTGTVLAQIGEKYDYERIGRARSTNDTLIGTSAARPGIVLLTRNTRDFGLIAEFCPLQYQLVSEITREVVRDIRCWCYGQHQARTNSRDGSLLDSTHLSQHAHELCLISSTLRSDVA